MSLPSQFGSPSLHVSHSQVATYLTCPERYRQKYVLGREPAHRSGEQIFGTAMHAALATFHLHLRDSGERPPLEDIQREFDALFAFAQDGPIPILWNDAESPEQMTAQAHQLLALYWESASIFKVLAVEQPFAVTREQLPRTYRFDEPVVGIVDVVEMDRGGQVFITELKTSGRRYDEARLRYDLQLSIYAAIAASLGFQGARVRFRVLVRTKTPQLQSVDVVRAPDQVAEAGHVVSEVLRAIDHNIFFPNRGHNCGTCPYRSRCGS